MAHQGWRGVTACEEFERLDEAWSHFPDCISLDYQVGPSILRLCFDPSLQKLTKALSHLEIERREAPPDLTICLWNGSQARPTLPPLDGSLLRSTHYCGHQEGDVYFHWFEAIPALSVLHLEKKRGYFVVPRSEGLPWWVEGSPLQALLHIWLQHQGLQLTHTAAVGNEQGAVLLTGKGGSGKSTTTLACLRAGFHYIGEDYSILEAGSEPRVWSIYHSAKWRPHTRTLFPHYEAQIANPAQADQEKALLFYKDLFPGQLRASLPIRAVVSLSVGQDARPRLQPSDPFSAIQHLMMSTLKQLPFCGPQTVQFFKNIGSSMNHFQLVLGKDLQANVEVLQALLS